MLDIFIEYAHAGKVAMKRRLVTTDLPSGALVMLECGHSAGKQATTGELVDCASCDRRCIPASTRWGRRTPTFDRQTVPPALLQEHRTSGWAELVAITGSVTFHDTHPVWTATATPGRNVVIVPGRLHHIEPDSGAAFYVQFHDLPAIADDTDRL